MLLAVMLAMLADEQNRCKMLEDRLLERSSSSHINEAHLPLEHGRWGEGTSKFDVVSSVWKDEEQKTGCTKSVGWRGEAGGHEREGGRTASTNFASDTTKGISVQNAGSDLQNF